MIFFPKPLELCVYILKIEIIHTHVHIYIVNTRSPINFEIWQTEFRWRFFGKLKTLWRGIRSTPSAWGWAVTQQKSVSVSVDTMQQPVQTKQTSHLPPKLYWLSWSWAASTLLTPKASILHWEFQQTQEHLRKPGLDPGSQTCSRCNCIYSQAN